MSTEQSCRYEFSSDGRENSAYRRAGPLLRVVVSDWLGERLNRLRLRPIVSEERWGISCVLMLMITEMQTEVMWACWKEQHLKILFSSTVTKLFVIRHNFEVKKNKVQNTAYK